VEAAQLRVAAKLGAEFIEGRRGGVDLEVGGRVGVGGSASVVIVEDVAVQLLV